MISFSLARSVTSRTNIKPQCVALLALCAALAGCMSASQHHAHLGSSSERALTLGTVQREIKTGMPQADVATALGSPNIVTGDVGNREVWIYDKIATETSYSSDSGLVGSQLAGAAVFPNGGTTDPSGNLNGNISGSYSKHAGAASFTQRTLTVVIKFTGEKTVESVSYNSTRF